MPECRLSLLGLQLINIKEGLLHSLWRAGLYQVCLEGLMGTVPDLALFRIGLQCQAEVLISEK